MVDINGLRCYIHMKIDCCETGDNPSLKVFLKQRKMDRKLLKATLRIDLC